MGIKQRNLVGLAACLTLFIASCAVSTDYSEGGNPMPGSWALAAPVHLNQCASIDGEYQTLGLGRLKANENFTKMRLDVAFGHAIPSNNMPEDVRISVNKNTEILTYQFGHPVNQSFSMPTHCRDGWYRAEKKQKDVYIGEGGTLDYSIRKIEIGKSVDESLILHLLLEVQSSSYLALKARDTREIWSIYKKINSEN